MGNKWRWTISHLFAPSRPDVSIRRRRRRRTQSGVFIGIETARWSPTRLLQQDPLLVVSQWASQPAQPASQLDEAATSLNDVQKLQFICLIYGLISLDYAYCVSCVLLLPPPVCYPLFLSVDCYLSQNNLLRGCSFWSKPPAALVGRLRDCLSSFASGVVVVADGAGALAEADAFARSR